MVRETLTLKASVQQEAGTQEVTEQEVMGILVVGGVLR